MDLGAPIELMAAFLVIVSDIEFEVQPALELCRDILQYEPTNEIAKQYEVLLTNLKEEGVLIYRQEGHEQHPEREDETKSGDSSDAEDESNNYSDSDTESSETKSSE